ncbi:MAG TPA: DUF2501 domain-containing protein [Telluria sp.]
MKRPIWQCAALALAATLPVASANAQMEGLLGKGGQGNGLSGLAGMATAPMTSGSMGNVAGLLQYCIGNNYLSGDGAASIKDKLMAKLPGGAQTQDPGYSDGAKGLLLGSNGNRMDFSGGGLKAEVTKRACDTVLAQAKSLL